MMRAILVALLTALAPFASQGQPVNLEGASVDCGTWVDARSQKRAVALEHFLLGLLNGMSMGSGIEFWRANGPVLKRKQVYLWMDKYCRDAPLNFVVTGAHELMNEQTGGAYQRYKDSK